MTMEMNIIIRSRVYKSVGLVLRTLLLLLFLLCWPPQLVQGRWTSMEIADSAPDLVTVTAPPPENYALAFDGSDQVVIPHNNNLRGCLGFCFLVPTVLRGNARQGALRPNFAVLERRAFRVWVPTQSMGTSI